MATLGARLRGAREHMELTQLRASKALGVTNVQLSRYESDVNKPDPELLARMAKLYEVSIDYLVTGKSSTLHEDGSTISEEELEFLKWVDDNVESSFFYDFSKSPEESKREMMETLKFIWEKEKRRQGK